MTDASYDAALRPDVLSLGHASLQLDLDYYAWQTVNGAGRVSAVKGGTSGPVEMALAPPRQ